MIIESQFKDYYDYFAHQYPDKKIVYKRKTSQIETKDDPGLLKLCNDHTFTHTGHAQLSKLANVGGVSLLVIGGRVFPFKRCYSEEKGYYNDFKNPYSAVKTARKEKSNFSYLFRFRPSWSELETGSRNDLAIEVCQRLQCPVFLIHGESKYNHATSRYESIVELNPVLKDLSPSCSTWEAYQWIMEMLQSVEPVVPEPNNSDKIEQHGYDLKRSFRPKMKR